MYSDKHLSWSWAQAKQMYRWSREMRFPLLAGSSVPATFRRPELDYPLAVEFEDALMVGNGWVTDGDLFRDRETLQCFVERRKGGQTGIHALQRLQGDEVWRAAEQGKWSRELLHAALSRAEKLGPGRPEDVKQPVALLLKYNDGFRAAVVALGGLVNEYLVAFRVKGCPSYGQRVVLLTCGGLEPFQHAGARRQRNVRDGPNSVPRRAHTVDHRRAIVILWSQPTGPTYGSRRRTCT